MTGLDNGLGLAVGDDGLLHREGHRCMTSYAVRLHSELIVTCKFNRTSFELLGVSTGIRLPR